MKKFISIFCVLAMALSLMIIPAQASTETTVANPGFETGTTDGWTVATGVADACVQVHAGHAYSGDYGVKVTQSMTTAANEEFLTYDFAVEANKTYFISAMVKPRAGFMALAAASGCGITAPVSPLVIVPQGVDKWYNLVNCVTPTESGTAKFYIQRHWSAASVSGNLPEYLIDDVAIYELKLKEKTNLTPENGVISVNFPEDIGLTDSMVTLSSGTVTGVSYADGNWNIEYENLTPNASGTVSFNIPRYADSSINGSPAYSSSASPSNALVQSFDFTAGAPRNIVTNPGFEDGTVNGWTETAKTDASKEVGAKYAYTGNYGVRVVQSMTSSPDEEYITYNFPVEANKKYFVSAMVKPRDGFMALAAVSGPGISSPISPLVIVPSGVDKWYKLVNSVTPTEAGTASFYIKRHWNSASTSGNLIEYFMDDVEIYELKLKENANLAPECGVISVNFPEDIGLTANMITLSSGTVTGVTYARGNWNIAYENLAPRAEGTVSFNIPRYHGDNNNSPAYSSPTSPNSSYLESFNFTTKALAAPVVEGNVVTNPGFNEGNTNGWTVANVEGATIETNARYAYTGDYGVKVTQPMTTAANEEFLSYDFAVEANKTYFISAMVKPRAGFMALAAASGCGITAPVAPLVIVPAGVEKWYNLVNCVTPTESGTAKFYIQRHWKAASVSGNMPEYLIDDVAIYELKLKENANLAPESGVISVNFPKDIGLTDSMVTLSSGTVTGVTYADGNWNIAYANLTPGAAGTVSFNIPRYADNSINGSPAYSNPASPNNALVQTFNFTTEAVTRTICDNAELTATGKVMGDTLTISLTADEAKTVYVAVADYTGTKMTAIQFAKPYVTSEGTEVEFADISDNYKIFIWNTGLTPICNVSLVSGLK